MQNAQNTDIQRVMNLVDLYRTKMYEKHTTQTQDLSKHFSKEEIDCLEKNGEKVVTKAYIGIDRSKVEFYFFNEQLLGHFYAIVAGSDAKKDVLQQLLPDFYDTTIFTQKKRPL